MRQKPTVLTLLFVMAISVMAESQGGNDQSRTTESIVGIWKGKFEEAPALDIELKVSSGKLVGIATFYLVQNTDGGPSIKSMKGSPIIDPSFDGRDLLFKVKRGDGSFLKARMRFVAENEAVFKPIDGSGATDEGAMYMTREK
jgi:hypothetical protein